MSEAPRRILVDTNVWLDAYDGNRLGSKRANELIDCCEKAGVELLYAAESVKDVYYLISASLKRQARKDGGALSESQAKAVSAYAFACVANMDEIATAVGMDSSDIWLAQKYRAIHTDFEDNLVLAAAQRRRSAPPRSCGGPLGRRRPRIDGDAVAPGLVRRPCEVRPAPPAGNTATIPGPNICKPPRGSPCAGVGIGAPCQA